MKSKRVVISATGALLLLSFAVAAYAHHGIVAWFDMTKSATVKGAVTGFDWTNPHSYIYIDVKDEKGAIQKWTAEMGSVGMLVRFGWRRDTLKPGDAISLVGKPAKDGKPSMLLDKVVLASGQELAASDLIVPVEGDPTPKP